MAGDTTLLFTPAWGTGHLQSHLVEGSKLQVTFFLTGPGIQRARYYSITTVPVKGGGGGKDDFSRTLIELSCMHLLPCPDTEVRRTPRISTSNKTKRERELAIFAARRQLHPQKSKRKRVQGSRFMIHTRTRSALRPWPSHVQIIYWPAPLICSRSSRSDIRGGFGRRERRRRKHTLHCSVISHVERR